MKALLLKDCYNLQKTTKTTLIIFLLYGIFGILVKQFTFVTSLVAIICAIMPISTFSYDDFSKWNNYALSMPITRKQIVYAKYLISLLTLIVGTVFAIILGLITIAINGTAAGSISEMLISTGTVALLGLLMISIVMPLTFKLGVEKARVAMIAVFLIPAALFFLLVNMPMPAWIPSDMELENILMLAAKIAPVIGFIIFALSILISVRIFSKKEF